MTEHDERPKDMTDEQRRQRADDPFGNPSRELQWSRDLDRRREAHDRDAAEREDQRRLEARQEELAEYLRVRIERFRETTGRTEVPQDVLNSWEGDFVAQKIREAEAERKKKHDRALQTSVFS